MYKYKDEKLKIDKKKLYAPLKRNVNCPFLSVRFVSFWLVESVYHHAHWGWKMTFRFSLIHTDKNRQTNTQKRYIQ